jgi:hypothetical protein
MWSWDICADTVRPTSLFSFPFANTFFFLSFPVDISLAVCFWHTTLYAYKYISYLFSYSYSPPQSVLSVVTLWTSHRLNTKRIRLLPMIMDYRLPLEIVVTSSILIVSNVGLRLEVYVLSVTKNGTSRRLNVFLVTVNLEFEETKKQNINLLYFYFFKWRLDGVKIRPTKKKQKRKET